MYHIGKGEIGCRQAQCVSISGQQCTAFKLMMNESLPLPAECLKQSETTLVQAVVLLGSIISLQIVNPKC